MQNFYSIPCACNADKTNEHCILILQRPIQRLTSASGSLRKDSTGFDRDTLRALLVAGGIYVNNEKERELLHLRILADVVYMATYSDEQTPKTETKVNIPEPITE